MGWNALLTRLQNRPERIIVSGLPRSGTSMMMRMLEAAGVSPLTDELRQADADNPEGYYEFERVKKLRSGDTAWLKQAEGKAVKVIAALLPYLPKEYTYKVIFMRRRMEEILASQRQMLLRRGENPDAIRDEQMSAIFQRHLDDVETWLNSQKTIQCLDIDYNAMLAEPAPQVQALGIFLRLKQPERMLSVVNPDLYRQRQNPLTAERR